VCPVSPTLGGVKRLEWTLAAPADVGMPEVEAMADEAVGAGCVPLGRVRADVDEAGRRWERHLAADVHDEWQAVVRAPVHVLRTADARAVVEAGKFWRVVSVRALTALSDGSIVETLLDWAETPPWPGNLQHAHGKARLEEEMLRNDAPGRSVRHVPRGGVADLLGAHERHVSEVAHERGAEVLPISSFDDAMALVGRCFAHARAVGQRVGYALTISSAAMVLFALVLCIVAPVAWWVTVIGVLWAVLTYFVLTPSWWVFFSYARWIRPSFPTA